VLASRAVSSQIRAAEYGGPTALGDDLRRFANLTWTLAVTDFKLRFFGSFLGYLWTLMRPLMLFGVLYFVFTQVVKFGEGVEHYPVYLLTSVVLFTFISESTSRGVLSLVERENLLRKIRFPRLVIPCSVALHALFNLGLNLVVVFVFVLASGIDPRLEWLELLPLLALLVALGTGLTMLLSALYVRYRDIQPIWDVALQVLFYGSPIFYVIDAMPDSVEEIAAVSPIAVVLTQARHAVIDPSAPTAADSMGGDALLLIPVAIVAVVLALGLWVFARETPRLAENL
jgi:ABC-2 type transport system permease protein